MTLPHNLYFDKLNDNDVQEDGSEDDDDDVATQSGAAQLYDPTEYEHLPVDQEEMLLYSKLYIS